MRVNPFTSLIMVVVAAIIFLEGYRSLAQVPAPDADVMMLRDVPLSADGSYHCAAIVHVVNRLRQLGKDGALTTLQTFLTSSQQSHSSATNQVELICRLLFVNPNGWSNPGLGGTVPAIDFKVTQKFPVFPFALSDNVPFFLLIRYGGIGGRGPNPQITLDECRKFSIISHDFALTEYDKAARDLIDNPLFKQLYVVNGKPDAKTLAEMSDLILQEAKSWDDKSAMPTTNPDTMPTYPTTKP